MTSPASQSLVETIRGAIREAGKPVYLVAKEAKVSQPILSRFLSGKRGMNLQTADRLCRSLGLELRRTEAQGNSALDSGPLG